MINAVIKMRCFIEKPPFLLERQYNLICSPVNYFAQQHSVNPGDFTLSLTGPECSRNFTSSSGVIKSPGFPEKYPNSLECTYIIFAPKMSEIILEFESFELEPDSNTPGGAFCRYDRLEIWDGFPDGKRKMDCDMHNHYVVVGCRRHVLIFLIVIVERSLLDLCETS